jgi:uncharacterized membrane protein
MTSSVLVPDRVPSLPAPEPGKPQPPISNEAVPQWLRVTIVLFIALGIFFRAYHLDRKVLWEDEIYGVVHMLGYTEAEIVQSSRQFTAAADLQRYFSLPDPLHARSENIADTVRSLASEDPQHPPLYYVLLHLWVEHFGSSVAAMRSLSALFGILALPCMYFLCIELFASRTAAWLGVAFVAISPFHVLYAQEVREYSLWTVATLLMSLTLLRAIRLKSVAAWALYGITFALSMYVYPFSGLVALGEGAFVLFATGIRPHKTLYGYLLATLAGFALFVPWLLITIRSAGLLRGMSVILTQRLSPRWVLEILSQNVRSAFFDFGLFHQGLLRPAIVSGVLTIFVLVLIGYALVTLLRSDTRDAWPFALIALCLPLGLLVLHDLFVGGSLVSQTRYFTPLYLGIELVIVDLFRRKIVVQLVGTGAALTFRILLVVVLAGGALSCAVSSQAQTWATKDFEQNRAIAQIVNRSDRPLVVSDFRSSRILGLGYYLDPSVKLKLNVRCDQCTVRDMPKRNMLDGTSAAGEIFLLGPSAELQREADRRAAGEHVGSNIRTIDVKLFPDRRTETNRLTMFAPI